jgi:hypothetical protein
MSLYMRIWFFLTYFLGAEAIWERHIHLHGAELRKHKEAGAGRMRPPPVLVFMP